MADALCGPSNALQSFQKHAQVDRTLQQDRLANRQPSHENFRSGSLTPSAQTEAEFEAFQKGVPLGIPPSSFLAHQSAPVHHAPSPQTGLPAWATDFQQLSIHDARQSPIPAAHFRHEAPLQRSSPGPWHTEFMRQERTATPPVAPQFQSPLSPTFGQPSYMGMNSMSTFGSTQGLGVHNAAQNTSAVQVDHFDDEAFAAAFDNAAAMLEEPQQSKPLGKGKEKAAEPADVEAFDMSKACCDPLEPFDFDSFTATLEGQHKEIADSKFQDLSIGGHTVSAGTPLAESRAAEAAAEQVAADDMFTQGQSPYQVHQNDQMSMQPVGEGEELARTAGQLLDNLKDEHSEKFAKSNFMTLMRQLRDKEVKVDGERFVEVSEAQEPDHGSRGEFSASVWT